MGSVATNYVGHAPIITLSAGVQAPRYVSMKAAQAAQSMRDLHDSNNAQPATSAEWRDYQFGMQEELDEFNRTDPFRDGSQDSMGRIREQLSKRHTTTRELAGDMNEARSWYEQEIHAAGTRAHVREVERVTMRKALAQAARDA